MGLFNYLKNALVGNDKPTEKTAQQANEKDIGPVYNNTLDRLIVK